VGSRWNFSGPARSCTLWEETGQGWSAPNLDGPTRSRTSCGRKKVKAGTALMGPKGSHIHCGKWPRGWKSGEGGGQHRIPAVRPDHVPAVDRRRPERNFLPSTGLRNLYKEGQGNRISTKFRQFHNIVYSLPTEQSQDTISTKLR